MKYNHTYANTVFLVKYIINISRKSVHFLQNNFTVYVHITRGPRGPWVAHLRKRSTVEPIIENPRGII